MTDPTAEEIEAIRKSAVDLLYFIARDGYVVEGEFLDTLRQLAIDPVDNQWRAGRGEAPELRVREEPEMRFHPDSITGAPF